MTPCSIYEVDRMKTVNNYRNLRDVVFHAADNFPETRFFISEDASFPYVLGKDLKSFCGKFSHWIQENHYENSHIALLGPNCAAWLTCFFSVLSSSSSVQISLEMLFSAFSFFSSSKVLKI